MVEVSFLRKLLLMVILTAFFISAANAQLIAVHELPQEFVYNTDTTGKIMISPTTETKFDISLMLPVRWEITDWNVAGNISKVNFEKTTVSYKGKVNEAFHWLFDGPVTKDIVLEYTTKPMSTGNHNITILWFYSGGFGSKDDNVYVSGERWIGLTSCGNRICEGAYGETLFNCPLDCTFKYLENVYIWLAILSIALLIMFFGLMYRLYQKYKESKEESFVPEAEPVRPMVEPEQGMLMPLPPPPAGESGYQKPAAKHRIAKRAARVKPVRQKAVKIKIAKKKTKKPGKKKAIQKKKAPKKTMKHSDFYLKTMKKLESIKKSLE